MVKRTAPLKEDKHKNVADARTARSPARAAAPAEEAPSRSGAVAGGGAKRREQQRAIDTREAILRAALSEFAERGFDAASIRNIGTRTGLQHPLITYHYRTKEVLWKAVAENAFAEIRKLWDDATVEGEELTPIEYLRREYSTFLRFTISHPDFHHFMIRESRPGNPRLPWLVETILLPTMQRLIPQIEGAQEQGDLPKGSPILVHYMLIGMTSVLSSLKAEIRQAAGIVTEDSEVVEAYLQLLDAAIFRPSDKAPPATPAPGRRSTRQRRPGGKS